MPKGSNYPGVVDAASLQKAQKATADFKKSLDFVPNLGPDVLTSATITPERLPLADKALEVALAAPDVMRRAFDPQRLTDKLAYYRALNGLRNDLATADKKLKNALNVLGADMMFDIGHIHHDIEEDNGETVDLGPMRAQLHDYYTHDGAADTAATKKP
ncbi:hypothetical protein [Hymenobacter terricola]|uniref:hypothetical protein n=1 Tax=Hymenobacter terricola TaxID=2819236 RepID=UPI001B310960|nr:hypothetical protein [Hymenobacter terricola]